MPTHPLQLGVAALGQLVVVKHRVRLADHGQAYLKDYLCSRLGQDRMPLLALVCGTALLLCGCSSAVQRRRVI